MNDSDIEDRLHRMLEGSLDETETAKLRSAIVRDPALARQAEELEAAFGALSGARLVDPPPGIREAVLREIRPVAAPRRAPAAAGWTRFLLPVAAAASALLVLGVLLAPRADHAPGTIAGTIGDASPSGTQQARIARGTLGTYALTRVDASHAALAVEAGARPLTVAVRWRAGAIRNAVLDSGGSVTPAATGGVRFDLPPGARDRLVLGTDGAGALRLEIFVIEEGREAPVGTLAISPERSTR
jgi:hypothetical protein